MEWNKLRNCKKKLFFCSCSLIWCFTDGLLERREKMYAFSSMKLKLQPSFFFPLFFFCGFLGWVLSLFCYIYALPVKISLASASMIKYPIFGFFFFLFICLKIFIWTLWNYWKMNIYIYIVFMLRSRWISISRQNEHNSINSIDIR